VNLPRTGWDYLSWSNHELGPGHFHSRHPEGETTREAKEEKPEEKAKPAKKGGLTHA